MTQYILNYEGGMKGDFLCNHINFNKIKFEDNSFNRSKSHYAYFKKLIMNEFSLDTAQEFLDRNSSVKIFPAHNAYKIPKEFLDKNNIVVIHLMSNRGYFKTIQIESMFKNLLISRIVDTDYKLRWNWGDNKNDEIIEYAWDIQLRQSKLTINNENRIKLLKKKLENPFLSEHMNKLEFIKQTNSENIFWDYKNIFIDLDFSKINELFEIDNDMLVAGIEKTWLPDQIEIFGEMFDIKSYGYRKYLS